MRPFAAALLLAVSALCAWKLDAVGAGLPAGAASADPLSRVIGSAREAVGDTLFIKADEYFHGGVMHEHHRDESAADLAREGVFRKEGREHEARGDWISEVDHAIHAHELMHLTKEKRQEMLPFFKWATSLDPYNVEAVLTAAYWLDREFGKMPEAAALLEKGVRDNPDSWELEHALAKMLSRDASGAGAAEPHFREALRKSAQKPLEDFERVSLEFDRAENLAALGRRDEALAAYERAARYFDSKTTEHLQSVIRDKIKQLSGASVIASEAKQSMA